jgi:hypothetical protein
MSNNNDTAAAAVRRNRQWAGEKFSNGERGLETKDYLHVSLDAAESPFVLAAI